MLYAIVAVLVIIVDQWVKYWVAGSISMESVGETFIPGVLSLVNLHNDGAAFSILSGGGARIYFIILTGVFTLAVILALATNFISGPVGRWSIVLVTAGGLSNCIDRIIYGYVQDMFKLELFDFPVFNVADIFITVFCLIFVFAVIFEKDPPADEYDQLFEEDDEEEDRPRRKFGKKSKEPELSAAEEKPEKKGRKARKAKYEDEYEQYKAARAARQQPAPAAAPAPVKAKPMDPSDPFAEWEKANAKVEAQQKNSFAAKAAGVSPSQPAKAPQPKSAPVQRPVQTQPVAAPAAPKPVAAQPTAPQRQSTAKPAPAKDDFSLDDILSEFK